MHIDSLDLARFLHDPRFSPDGSAVLYRVSAIDPDENEIRTDLYILRDERPVPLTRCGKVTAAVWDGDTVLFASRRNQKEEKTEPSTEWFRIDPNGGEAERAFALPAHVSELLRIEAGRYIACAAPDPFWDDFSNLTPDQQEERRKRRKKESAWTELAGLPFWHNGGSYAHSGTKRLFLYEEEADRWTPLTPADRHASDPVLSRGKDALVYLVRSAATVETLENRIGLLHLKDLSSREIEPFEGSRIAHAAWLGEDIVFAATDGKIHGINQDPDWYRLSIDEELQRLTDDAEKWSLFGTVGSDLRFGGGQDVLTDSDSIYFVATVREKAPLLRWKDGKVETALSLNGSVDSFDVNGEKIIAVGLTEGTGQELYDEWGKRLTRHNDGLPVARPIERFTFSSGGTERTGFFLRPSLAPGETAPAILTIHGGPKTVYGTVLHHEMQVLAEQGFFVFYTNPRGSDGHGRDFSDIRGKYGTVDYDDLMAATDAFLAHVPEADPHRLGVMGGSYGGWMTNWIIGHTNRFRAACSQRSISNWISFFGNSDIGWFFADDQLGGSPWNNTAFYHANSPIAYADRVTTPTLFIHSDEDYRCWLPEGLQMYTALLHFGVPAKMVVFHGENHELSRSGKPQSRKKRLSEIVEWFQRWLAPEEEQR